MTPLGRADWEALSGRTHTAPISCRPSFADILDRSWPGTFRPKAWRLKDHLLVGYETGGRWPRLELSPHGLAAGFTGASPAARHDLLQSLAASSNWRSIILYFPFDAEVEELRPWRWASSTTHVLDLDDDYEALFTRRFKGATRTCIRRAESSEVAVEVTRDERRIAQYYEVHRQLAEAKGNYEFLHPYDFLRSLVVDCEQVEFAVAVRQDQVIAGGIFFRDGPGTFYWHGAADREHAPLQPTYAVLAHTIRRATSRGDRHFNFGASPNLPSVAKFKESWGATERVVRVASLSHPLIRAVKRLTGA